ncbi:MAG TPA: MazG family protein [Streptosporangiaceae bacterium]|nr:MazG family protein [Streptosporangiaceae bacterium]
MAASDGTQNPDVTGSPAGVPAGSGGRPAGAALLQLVEIMDRLRVECPWDAKQTHESLAPYLLEETYEALDALDRRDMTDLREELGDVLLQVLFHARVAAERADRTGFTIDDVAEGIAAKLVRRHPHVFADVTVSGAEDVKRNWDAIKASERAAATGAPASALDGVPMGQPALSLAAQLLRRAKSAGIPAEVAELPVTPEPEPGSAGEIGGELFALAARARAAGLDPEFELRHAARIFSDRVRDWERRAGSALFRMALAALRPGPVSYGQNVNSFDAAPASSGPQASFGGNAGPALGPAGQPSAGPDPMAAGLPPELVAMARSGNLIKAIKAYRELTGVGLKEAKAVMEQVARGC